MSRYAMRSHRISTLAPEHRRQSARGLPCDMVEVLDLAGAVVFTGTLAQAQARVGDDDALSIRVPQEAPAEESRQISANNP